MRQVLLTAEVPQEWATFFGDVVADRSAQHRVTSFDRVEDGAWSDRAFDFERYFRPDVRKILQMIRQHDSDEGGPHGSV